MTQAARAGIAGLVAVAFAFAALSVPDASAAIKTIRVASGLARPCFVTAPLNDLSRLFVVEQRSGSTGAIRIVKDGVLLATPFLSVSGVTTGSEQGLLGLAFHPDYATNRLFYVYYTTTGGGAAGHSVLAEYEASAGNADVATPSALRTILTVDQPNTNHNGGWMAFGPDGYLYVALGDGGGGGDTGTGHDAVAGNAQDITANLLGKILRIDVNGDDFPGDATRNYRIPPTNPFVGAAGDDEIWAYGLRNPWRDSFDRLTGDLYIGDVGQESWEEVDYQEADAPGGANYGWRCREATHDYNTSNCNLAGLTPPIYEYGHSTNVGNPFVCGVPNLSMLGCAITGGYVYRGAIPEIQGRYFFADYCSSRIASFAVEGGAATDCREHTSELAPGGGLSISSISSFGEDASGELYICDLNGGEVFRIVPVVDADVDADGDVDLDDFAPFSVCFNGSAKPPLPACAVDADFDNDGDVDIDDFARFSTCYNGPLRPANCVQRGAVGVFSDVGRRV